MRRLMTGPVWLSYGQIYVETSDAWGDLGESFGGQQNGLCGVAVKGRMTLMTGLHTGEVDFTAELHDDAPPIDDEWEEIVEASFEPDGPTTLTGLMGSSRWTLDLELVSYRVRYCAWGMDLAHETLRDMDEDSPPLDRYLVQFWPAPPEPDRIVKQTGTMAAYWHDFARKQPPPPTAAERAETKRQAELERERASAAAALAEETRNWGGTLPSEGLRALSWTAIEVAQLDRPLADAVDALDPTAQRLVAGWSARHAYAEAQLDQVDWITPALTAMDRGEPLAPPFDNDLAWNRLFEDESVPKTVITTLDGDTDNFLQQAMAFPALVAAYDEDPLRAAIEALRIAVNTAGLGRDQAFFADLRRAFPSLR